MSVGKAPKIPETKPPAAAPPAANTETAALETGADESDLVSQLDKQRKGRSALRIEEGRAGKSSEASRLNTSSMFMIGNTAPLGVAPKAPKPADKAATITEKPKQDNARDRADTARDRAAVDAARAAAKDGGSSLAPVTSPRPKANPSYSKDSGGKGSNLAPATSPRPKANPNYGNSKGKDKTSGPSPNSSYSANPKGSKPSSKRDSSK